MRDLNGDGSVDLSDVKILLQNDRNVLAPLETGDFRSRECLALLRESDIVVTNPPSPFSANMWRSSWNTARNSSSSGTRMP